MTVIGCGGVTLVDIFKNTANKQSVIKEEKYIHMIAIKQQTMFTITGGSVAVQSVAGIAAACVAPYGVMAVLITGICLSSTLVKV